MDTVRLSTADIPYLNQEVIEDFCVLKVYSVDHQLVKMNPLVLAAMNSSLAINLDDYEDCCVITEFTQQELQAVKEFSWTGQVHKSVSNVFKALGMDLQGMFEKINIEVKPEVDHDFDDFNFDEDYFAEQPKVKRKKRVKHNANTDDEDDEDFDYELYKKKANKKTKKKIIQHEDDFQEEVLDDQALTSDQQALFDNYALPKSLEDYKHEPVEPKVTFSDDNDDKKCIACHLCSSRFYLDAELQQHLIRFHSVHLSCEFCYQTFNVFDNDKFRLHMFKHEQNLLISTCIQCGASFKKTNKFTEHMNAKGPYHDDQCAQCTHYLTSYSDHQQHVKDKHANLWKYKCGFCKELFNLSLELNKHCKAFHANKSEKKKEPKKKTVCVECGTLITNLKHHMSTVHSNQVHTCPHCSLEFKAMPLLQRHIDWIHVKAPCAECGEMVGLRKMPRHMKQKHTSIYDRKYKCETCGKGFSSNAALRDHINVHTGAKPYKCKFCSAAFASVGTHAMHQRSHLGHRRSK